MEQYIKIFGVELKEGAAEIIDYLQSRGIKTALATASPLKRAADYLKQYGIFDKFDAVVSGAGVARSKPASDIYLKAADELGLPPWECMAVEDSPTGILSAHDAGCLTVMIPDLTPPDDETLRLTDCVLKKLTDIRRII